MYLAAAILCGFAAFQRFYPAAYIPIMIIYLVYAVFLFFTNDGVRDWIKKYKMQHIAQTMQATKPYIEKTREFFGLLIITRAILIDLQVSHYGH